MDVMYCRNWTLDSKKLFIGCGGFSLPQYYKWPLETLRGILSAHLISLQLSYYGLYVQYFVIKSGTSVPLDS